MKATVKKLALTVGTLLLAVSCSNTSETPNQQSPEKIKATNSPSLSVIKVDGSSTVYPITQAIVKEFLAKNNTPVEVNISGTGGGFEQFCIGKIHINNASRPISQVEMALCNKNDIRYIELPIAFDALTIVVHPQNNWAKDITVAELKQIWQPAAAGKITKWNQIRSSWPDRPLKLYGAGQKSGTYDYFTEAIVGKAKSSRNDYIASENDDDLVAGISKDTNALGYFGYAYYQKNKDKLAVLAVNNGKGAILPSQETVEKSKYQPLSRPLFIYVNLWSDKNRGELYKFVDFYLQKAPTIVNSVGSVPLPAEAYQIDYVHLHEGKAGTVFAGKAELDLTIGELLRKQKQF